MKKILLLIIASAFSVTIATFAQDYSDYTECAEQDSLALVAFYWATDGPNWISNKTEDFNVSYLSDDVKTYYTDDYPNAGFNHWFDGPVKDWFGVTLAKRQVGNTTDSVWRVIHLHPTISRRSAGQNDLNGYVPKEVGLLTALEWFKINGNDGLEGTEVPDEIYHSSIKALDFEGVFFSGILSDAVCNCTNLKYPNFRDNNFDSIPNMDFLTGPTWCSFFIYRNRVPWSALEESVTYCLENEIEYEARDQSDVGRAKEIIVTPGSTVTLTCNYAGENGTCTWYKKGMNTYLTGTTYTIDNISASDTGNYTVKVGNEYIRLNDENADYASTYTKPIHVTFVPSTPVLEKAYSSYDGNSITLEFSKPMAVPSADQCSEFTVKQNGENINVNNLTRTGRLNNRIVLSLDSSLVYEDSVSITYTKGDIVDTNGGEVNSFTDINVNNYTREAFNIASATTRTDGSSIILEFDKYVDPTTFTPSNFSIGGTNNYTVESISIIDGEIDTEISRKIALVTSESMEKEDEIKVSYIKGSMTALYGAALQSFNDFSVENIITDKTVPFYLKVIDGTGELNNIVIKGNMKSRAFYLYDDGTNGDKLADDDIWTTDINLNDGDYNWAVYSRTTTITYDTVRTTDPITGSITLTLTPVENYNDSLLSADKSLGLSVSYNDKSVTGDTVYNYRTKSVTFILDMNNYISNNPNTAINPYLMGINDDWSKGISMSQYGNTANNQYSTTIKAYTEGDVVSYNFRNDDDWENQSANPRTHTIIDIDTVNVSFGTFASQEDILSNKGLSLFPNPVKENTLWFSCENKIIDISIFDLQGKQILKINNPVSPLDISTLNSGIYLIKACSQDNKQLFEKFIKK